MIKPRVAVIFGGRSGEHQISCATAASVLEAIDRDRFDVVPIGITETGQWVRVPDDPQLYQMRNGAGAVVAAQERSVGLWPGSNSLVELAALGDTYEVGSALSAADLGRIDVAFPLLHGPYGEDGIIQGYLEACNTRYVGCGVAASAVGMDKHFTKTVLRAAGIAVGRWTVITERMWLDDRALALENAASVGAELFIKPCRAGSSLGVSHVVDDADIEEAIERAREYDPRVIVEGRNLGREIECGVLEFADGPRASVCGEIALTGDGFYDYSTKYRDHDAVQLSCPASLPEDVSREIRAIAVEAFTALGCEGLARVDFFYDESNDQITLNEVNTMPGMTPWSMYPAMWDASGVNYRELLSHLIDRAMQRRGDLR